MIIYELYTLHALYTYELHFPLLLHINNFFNILKYHVIKSLWKKLDVIYCKINRVRECVEARELS